MTTVDMWTYTIDTPPTIDLTGFKVEADGVQVEYFEISGFGDQCGILVTGQRATIQSNDVHHNHFGICLQAGAQTFSQVIFFKDQAALDNFKRGDYEVAAGASAIALADGVSKTADYNNGVAIFTMGTGGLMFEASIGGQKFSYEPK